MALPPLLGEQARLLCPEARCDPRRGERVSRRALSSAAELDGAGLSQARLLQQARQGRALRGMGTAATLLRRDPGCVSIAPLTVAGSSHASPLTLIPCRPR